MKTDLPTRPVHPPKKRRALHDPNVTPAIWLHEWADDESLPARERGRADEELRRRRAADKRPAGVVGLVASERGVTAAQTSAMMGVVKETPDVAAVIATSTLGRWLVARGNRPPSALAELMDMGLGVAVNEPTAELRDAVRHATSAIVMPPDRRLLPSADRTAPVWAVARFARHRKIPVTVIMADGAILKPDGTLVLPDGTQQPGGAWT